MKNWKSSIKTKLIMIIICVIFIITTVTLGVSSFLNYQTTIDTLKDTMKETVKIASGRVQAEIDGDKRLIYMLSKNPIICDTSKSIEERFAELKNEIAKLETGNVLKNLKIGEEEQNLGYVSERTYAKEDDDYKTKYYYFKNSEIEIEIENKTGKILSILFPKESLLEDTQEMKKNFVKYLDLYIIDDWKLENNSLKSEKAQLEVVLVETEMQCRLMICPMGSNAYYEMVEKAE